MLDPDSESMTTTSYNKRCIERGFKRLMGVSQAKFRCPLLTSPTDLRLPRDPSVMDESR